MLRRETWCISEQVLHEEASYLVPESSSKTARMEGRSVNKHGARMAERGHPSSLKCAGDTAVV